MDDWHGFETARNVAQIYETTISDTASDLSAHFVTVPARSLGGSSYLFQGSDWPLESLGLLRIADVPFGSVARSLAACLVSEDVEEFMPLPVVTEWCQFRLYTRSIVSPAWFFTIPGNDAQSTFLQGFCIRKPGGGERLGAGLLVARTSRHDPRLEIGQIAIVPPH